MFTKLWITTTAERAIKTFAQALLAAATAGGFGVLNMPWLAALDVALMAAVLSVLTSIVSGFVPTDPVATPSLVPSTPPAAPTAPAAPAAGL